MSLLWVYKKAMTVGEPVIRALLHRRVRLGKEIAARLPERYGIASHPRPGGPLIWVHVASVGEAQSMFSLIDLILAQSPETHLLVTSITVNAARLLETRLPPRAFHQFFPVDHPDWVRRFLDHWNPDMVLWAESELWPNALTLIRKRRIPAALLNARLSPRSLRNWSYARTLAEEMIAVFTVIIAQSEADAAGYTALGARSLVVAENLKYAASPLPCDPAALEALRHAAGHRAAWLYASTHDGEEELAAGIHRHLKQKIPSLLTVIVPRHPERRREIAEKIAAPDLKLTFRGEDHRLPESDSDIYIADTLGELGLFYRFAGLACIGRSFSRDGGGGHNPIEPALLRCAVTSGPQVQNLEQIYREMENAGALRQAKTPEMLEKTLETLLTSPQQLKELQESGYAFASQKTRSLNQIAEELEPLFLTANLPVLKVPA